MWKPSGLGDLIAERRLLLRHRGKHAKLVRVRFGRPVRSPRWERGDPWWCPVQILGLGETKMTPIAGEDSVQALVLAFRFVEAALKARGGKAGGQIQWLGERERPIFAHTFLLETMEAAIKNLVDGLRAALDLLENAREGRTRRQTTKGLRRLAESSGFAQSSAGGRPKGRGSG